MCPPLLIHKTLTLDILSGLGKYLLNFGIGSPFLNISQSYLYFNIHHAKNSIRQAGQTIQYNGLNKRLVPFVVGKLNLLNVCGI